MSTPAVLTDEYVTKGGEWTIELTLNALGSLNALSTNMIDTLLVHLPLWDADDKVVAIIIRGAGGRAFFARGDIRALYYAMAYDDTLLGRQFFNLEYSLNMMLHNLQTPLLAWGSGYVIGGGMGITNVNAWRSKAYSLCYWVASYALGQRSFVIAYPVWSSYQHQL